MSMKKIIVSASLLLLCVFLCAACGDDNGGSDDTATEDALPADGQDQQDQADIPPDRPADTPGEDIQPDPGPDVDDPAPDGTTACEEAGGYCATFPVIPDTCITCEDSEETHYWPAPPADHQMGCTVEGEGSGPWCCLPHEVTDPSNCESTGGECYHGGADDACPVGWGAVYTPCGGEGNICCMPGEHCL